MMKTLPVNKNTIDYERDRYPYCIVWTPIPFLTWFCPLLGHMGIAYSYGIIRDFSQSYAVSVDDFAYGKPTKYCQMSPNNVHGGQKTWDAAVTDASNMFGKRPYSIFCDICHAHVTTALNMMQYDNANNWNMLKLVFFMITCSKYVSLWGFVKTWLPFILIWIIILVIIICSVKSSSN